MTKARQLRIQCKNRRRITSFEFISVLGTIGTDCIGSEFKVLEGRELGQVGPQRLGTFVTDLIAAEVNVLQGRELGEVGPQRLGTIGTDSIAAEVKVLDAGELDQLGTQGRCSLI